MKYIVIPFQQYQDQQKAAVAVSQKRGKETLASHHNVLEKTGTPPAGDSKHINTVPEKTPSTAQITTNKLDCFEDTLTSGNSSDKHSQTVEDKTTEVHSHTSPAIHNNFTDIAPAASGNGKQQEDEQKTKKTLTAETQRISEIPERKENLEHRTSDNPGINAENNSKGTPVKTAKKRERHEDQDVESPKSSGPISKAAKYWLRPK